MKSEGESLSSPVKRNTKYVETDTYLWMRAKFSGSFSLIQLAMVRLRFKAMTSAFPTSAKSARESKGKGFLHSAMRESSQRIIGRITLRSLSRSTAESRKQSSSIPLMSFINSGCPLANALVHWQRQSK